MKIKILAMSKDGYRNHRLIKIRIDGKTKTYSVHKAIANILQKYLLKQNRGGAEMSYEGYTEYLCKKGHHSTTDCYAEDLKKCRCGEKIVLRKMVDTTNDEGNPLILRPKKQTICEHCETVLETTYYIPRRSK